VKLKQLIDDRVAQGARIAAFELSDGENPWRDGVGMFRDEPLFDDWQQAIADYRREAARQARWLADRRTQSPNPNKGTRAELCQRNHCLDVDCVRVADQFW
jgi:hypothetical protein